MKTSVLYLIAISFLFQSCYTYKAIDLKDTSLIINRNYKIIQTGKSAKVKLLLVNDSTLIVLQNNTQKSIQVSQIKEIKEHKISILKTVGLAASVGLITAAVIVGVSINDAFLNFTIPTN